MITMANNDLLLQNNQPLKKSRGEPDRLQPLFALAWGTTCGAVIGQALNPRMGLPMHLSPFLLPINWMIFPFQPLQGLEDCVTTTWEKVYRLSIFGLSSVFGFTTSYLTNKYLFNSDSHSEAETIRSYVLQTGLLALNLLSCYLLQRRAPLANRMTCVSVTVEGLNGIAVVISGCLNFFKQDRSVDISEYDQIDDDSGQNVLKNSTIRETEKLKKSNAIAKRQIAKIKAFIERDGELLSVFNECAQQTQEILLAQPVKDNSPPINNSIAEEWRQESLTAAYYDSLNTRMRDFLEKNPLFAGALRAKLEKMNQQENEEAWI